MTLDLNMPGIQGEELMRVIRREFPRVEVIVITGYGSVESAVEALRFGICDYIQKPFDVVKVLTAVGAGSATRARRRSRTGFLERLGGLLGRAEEVQSILENVERSPRMQRRYRRHDGRARTTLRARRRTASAAHVDLPRGARRDDRGAARVHARPRAAGLVLRRPAQRPPLPRHREQEHVRMAGFLHDVGKVGVPSELLARAGALDPQERRAVERHPVIGVGLVDPLAPAEVHDGDPPPPRVVGRPRLSRRPLRQPDPDAPRASCRSPTRTTR